MGIFFFSNFRFTFKLLSYKYVTNVEKTFAFNLFLKLYNLKKNAIY